MFYHCKRNTAWKFDHPQGMQTYVLQKIKLIHIRHAVFVLIVLHTGTWHYSFFLIKNIYPLPNNTLYIFYEKNLKHQVLVVLHYVILISRCMKKFTIKICAIFCNQTIGNYTRRLPFFKMTWAFLYSSRKILLHIYMDLQVTFVICLSIPSCAKS